MHILPQAVHGLHGPLVWPNTRIDGKPVRRELVGDGGLLPRLPPGLRLRRCVCKRLLRVPGGLEQQSLGEDVRPVPSGIVFGLAAHVRLMHKVPIRLLLSPRRNRDDSL